ncbi:MAG TPA: extracellular solute-binding protein [Patescibacteria group bacterium]|nr:extracellular solute-binding protein [Patescibacteria group bacterium]
MIILRHAFFKIISALVLGVVLASCSKENDSRGEPPKNADGKNIVRFWHFWSEPSQRKAIQQLVQKFEEKCDCDVQLTELSWNDGKTKLLAAFNSGTAPDVIELGSDWIPQFSSKGVLKELSDEIDKNRFVPFSLPTAQWKGKLYAAPWTVDTRVLFYNKELLKRAGLPETPPATIDEMLSAAEKIQAMDSKVYGFGANGADPHRLYKKILPMMWSMGGEIFTTEGKTVLNSNENVAALEKYVALSRTGLVETQRQIDAAFAQGNVAFWNSGSWLIDKIQRENSKLNYGVSVLPAGTSGRGISFAGGEYLAISNGTKQAELATKLVKFLTDGENALEFCKQVKEAGFPADASYYDDDYFKNVKFRPVFTEQLKNAKMTPVNPEWLEIEEVLENAVVQALYGEKSPRAALNEAQGIISSIARSSE